MNRHSLGILMFAVTSSVSIFLTGSTVNACVATRDPRYQYFISYERPYAGLFKDGFNSNEISPTIVDRCQESSGQYLMVALGVRSPRINGKTADISLTKKWNDDFCRIDQNPFPVEQKFENRLHHFESQYQLLRSCTFYDITDINGSAIQLPETQPAARVEWVSPTHIRAAGDFVFLKVSRNSRFSIGIGFNPECMKQSSLKKLKIQPVDVQALLNTYLTGDPSGYSTDLTPLGSSRVRIALTAGSDLMSVQSMSDQLDSPAWPTTYKTRFEFGSLTIRPQSDGRMKLDFSPLVDHFAPTRCVNGFCSAEQSFQSPLAGLMELKEQGGTRTRVMDSWYFGTIVPSQYQGFVESVPRYLDRGLMKVGGNYSLEFNMVDPYEDYDLFQNSIPQLLIDLQSMSGNPGGDALQGLGALTELTGLPSIPGMGKIAGRDWNRQIDVAIAGLSSSSVVRNWPSYFDQICTIPGADCFRRGKVKFIKKIGIRFTLGKIGPDQMHRMENPVIYRVDPVRGYEEFTNAVFPKIVCKGDRSQ